MNVRVYSGKCILSHWFYVLLAKLQFSSFLSLHNIKVTRQSAILLWASNGLCCNYKKRHLAAISKLNSIANKEKELRRGAAAFHCSMISQESTKQPQRLFGTSLILLMAKKTAEPAAKWEEGPVSKRSFVSKTTAFSQTWGFIRPLKLSHLKKGWLTQKKAEEGDCYC